MIMYWFGTCAITHVSNEDDDWLEYLVKVRSSGLEREFEHVLHVHIHEHVSITTHAAFAVVTSPDMIISVRCPTIGTHLHFWKSW